MTVYFARCLGEVPIKIGVVADRDRDRPVGWSSALEGRRLGLESQYGAPVSIVAATAGGLFVERWFHRRHRVAALGNELFQPSAEVLADIAAVVSSGRADGQPDEPSCTYFCRGALKQYRLLLGVSIEDMAAAMGIGASYYKQREGGAMAPIYWAIDLADCAARRGVDLPLRQILASSDIRYRTHVVRSIGNGAQS